MMMFSKGAKRGSQLLVDIIDNGYIITFVTYNEGKEERKKIYCENICDVSFAMGEFNNLEKA